VMMEMTVSLLIITNYSYRESRNLPFQDGKIRDLRISSKINTIVLLILTKIPITLFLLLFSPNKIIKLKLLRLNLITLISLRLIKNQLRKSILDLRLQTVR
jgi:Na+/H+ antiporter NhaD/arsenite permease-like protein